MPTQTKSVTVKPVLAVWTSELPVELRRQISIIRELGKPEISQLLKNFGFVKYDYPDVDVFRLSPGHAVTLYWK